MAIFARRLLGGQRCTIYGDGEQTRDYVYVADVAEAAELALVSAARGVVNISTGRETSVNALLRQVAAAVGVACDPEYAAARAGEVRRSVLANAHARALLGWSLAIRSSAASLRRSSGCERSSPRAIDGPQGRSIFTRRVSISPGTPPPALRASRNRRSKTQEVISPPAW